MAVSGLVDVCTVVPDILLDIRYARADNAFGMAFYPRAAAYLAEPAARKLARAAEELRRRGRRLVVFDAYRPLSVQKRLWDLRPDSRYVADPAKGSSHNRGAAVDVSLALPDGTGVEMPSDFDEFGPKASHGFSGASPAAARHAAMLREAMEGAGFTALEAEWWHYSDADLRQTPLLDVSFEKLGSL